ncbi:MAG: oligogalacturonate lyase family protein [Pirellulales bacterium]
MLYYTNQKTTMRFVSLITVLTFGFLGMAAAEDAVGNAEEQLEIPLEWTDPDTGFRVIRISRREGNNYSFYFHNNPFVPALDDEGDKMVFHGSTEKGGQLFALNLQTLAINQLTDIEGERKGEIVAPKHREAFFQDGRIIYATHVDTAVTRRVAVLPEDFPGKIKTINADETVLAGGHCEGAAELRRGVSKGEYMRKIFDARLPNYLFTLDIATGTVKKIHEINTWLGHWQFSPTDPKLLMFCHEGPWHELNRIWLIDITTRQVRPIRQRTVDMEIWGHEWWSSDGRTIWFDLQVPKGEAFYLAGYDLQSRQETAYSLTRNEWSTHYNLSQEQQLFAGDGGKRNSVARAEDGKWIYLFKPSGDSLLSTRLVNMTDHDYGLEPNVHFSPDGRWIIFRSNMHGPTHIYGVDLTSANHKPLKQARP